MRDGGAQHCSPHGARFTTEQHSSRLPSNEPYPPSAAYAVRCSHRDQIRVGESRIVVANVIDILSRRSGSPLVYCDRVFHTRTEPDAIPTD